MSRAIVLGLVIAALAAAVLWRQAAGLDDRPMHADEAGNAVRLAMLLEEGRYEFNPTEFHGPSLYYMTLPAAWWQGRTDLASLEAADLRIVAVLCMVGLILLLPLVADGLGRTGVVAAAGLVAVSPAMSYYGRYFIHEMPLVMFSFALIAMGWRCWRSPRLGWAIGMGVAAGLMHATKATCLIAWAAMAGAIGLCLLWALLMQRSGSGDDALAVPGASVSPGRARHVGGGTAAAVAAGVAVSVLLFSSFFTHLRGPLDSILTWGPYFGRGIGVRGDAADHVQPWYAYLQQLLYWRQFGGPVWTQALIVGLALIGAAGALLRRPPGGASPLLLRFLAGYTLLMVLIYSALPYKTPWLVLGMLHGMILLGGAALGMLWHGLRHPLARAVLLAVLAAGMWQLHLQLERANSARLAADARNPYAYAHTLGDITRLVERVDGLAAVHPQGRDLFIRIICEHPWPLPWYLRHYNRVGYWHEVPERVDAPVIITCDRLAPQVRARLSESMHFEFFGFRPAELLIAHVRRDLWEAYLETRR